MDNGIYILYQSVNVSGFHTMRHQEFNTKDVLGKAMHVFWQKGYKGASLQNLLDEMGIGKGASMPPSAASVNCSWRR